MIPKQHVEWVWDVNPLGGYFETVGKVARHLRRVSGRPVRLLVFGFDVPHAHVHLFPGRSDNLNGERLGDEQLRQLQEKFRIKEENE